MTLSDRLRRRLLDLLPLVVLLLGLSPRAAQAIPVFSRRYKVSCQLCHDPFPKLTAFGEQFAANGFRMAPRQESPDTLGTNDSLLTLPATIPLAVRVDGYIQAYSRGSAVTDFQAPYLVKLLSSATLGKTFSYYFYALLLEAGEPGGVEDAFLYANDLGGKPVDAWLGQFQVSDAMFSRELRLEFEDYVVYRTLVGAVPYDLTYDRGLGVAAEVRGFGLVGDLVNGNGIGPAQADAQFDVDAKKNVAARLRHGVGHLGAVGGLYYYGQAVGNGQTNSTTMLGADASFAVGIIQFNGQFLYRFDSDPLFTGGGPGVTTNGGFGELIVRPVHSRWYGYGLYNLVQANQPVLDVGLGLPPGLSRYESVAAGTGYLARRNLRLTSEAAYDLAQDEFRLTLGFSLAY
jgi:hypothetical protein